MFKINFQRPLVLVASTCLLMVLSTVAADSQKTQDSTNPKNSTTEVALKNSDSFKKNVATETSGRSMEAQSSSRGGRMLDLDRMAGDLKNKNSVSGERQSRMLTDETSNVAEKTEARSKKSKSKKMAIKGFIPIVSIENAKDGKHFDGSIDSSEDDEDDQQEEQQSQQQPQGVYATGNTREQLLSSFGSQTSIGHASSGVPHIENPSQDSNNNNRWQVNGDQDNQEQVARANRKLLGSSGLFNGIGTPNRLVSSLVPQVPMMGRPQLQLQQPMNLPNPMLESQSNECICVPFFQCKNGYLSESQLSKSQLNQMMFGQGQHPLQSLQVPRSLSPSGIVNQQQPGEMYYTSVAPPVSSLMSQLDSQSAGLAKANEQQIANDIYEQLRKKIERDNLEQQIQAAYPVMDERSKSLGNQGDNNNSTGEVEQRSILNPLGRRSSSGQQRCGIMRTCCKIPPPQIRDLPIMHNQQPHALAMNNLRPQTARLNEFNGLPYPSMAQMNRPNNQMGNQQYPLSQMQPMVAATVQQQHQAQIYQNQNQMENQGAASTGVVSNRYEPQMQSHQQHPVGSFMGGRCGIKQAVGISGRVQNAQAMAGGENTADFGEFPAHAAILKRISPGDSLFVCSAVLISSQWLATAAHCVRKLRPEELKVRLGEWDVNRDDEFYPFVESHVRDIVVHPEFQATSLSNDVALIRIDATLDASQSPHIAPACLATPMEQWTGSRCWVAGWGKDAFGRSGTFQSVLKKVDLPVVGRQECESALRFGTKLGKMFRLHPSSICAGGERGKDACEGDGGAGLYCSEPESGLIKVVGLVSWGMGCGQKGVPGVYTNIASFAQWIESVVAGSGEEGVYSSPTSNGIPEGMFKSLISERTNSALNGTVVDQNISQDEISARNASPKASAQEEPKTNAQQTTQSPNSK